MNGEPLVLLDQRPGWEAGAPWVIESGRRRTGCEDARRIEEIRAGLTAEGGALVEGADVPDCELRRVLHRVHDLDYLQALAGAGPDPVMLADWAAPGMSADTPVASRLVADARESVRTAIAAAHRTLAGEPVAYALCRPPGHHAGPSWLGGYCYFNNAAAAVCTLHEGLVPRVGVLDLDLHYPNGTAALASRQRLVALHSLHAWPAVNAPDGRVVPASPHEREFEFAEPPTVERYLDALGTSLELLGPNVDVLVVSLGYDIVEGDPHGCWTLPPAVFEPIGEMLAGSGLPLCIVQEGGYALERLADCAGMFARGLLGRAR